MFGKSVYMFAEFRNTSANTLVVPLLIFEAMYEGKGFGEQAAHSNQSYAVPGESVFFEGWAMYKGAVIYGDWNEIGITFEEGRDRSDEYSTLDLRLEREEGRIYNDGTSDIEGVNIDGIGRDADGVFVSTCYAARIDSTIPAGLFVRIPERNPIRPGPGAGCADPAKSFAERLGTTPISVQQWKITVG
jgi:hypothetical protein